MAHQANSRAFSSNTTVVLEFYPHWYLTPAKPSCLSYLWINEQPFFPPRIAFYPREGILTPSYTLNAQSHDVQFSCEYSLTFLFLRASNSFIDLHWYFLLVVILQDHLMGTGSLNSSIGDTYLTITKLFSYNCFLNSLSHEGGKGVIQYLSNSLGMLLVL